MVPLSKSGLAFGERGFESHPLRQLGKETKIDKALGVSIEELLK